MDIFRSDKAPYVLALLVSLIGWHITQIINQITSTEAVSYSVNVNRDTHEVSALITNVSRTKALVDATFSLECAPNERCFMPLYPTEEGADPIFGRVEAFVPNGLSRQAIESWPTQIRVTNTVAAGGKYRIIGRLSNPDASVRFFYLPTADTQRQPLNIYLYERGSLLGLLVGNYLFIVSISLVLCIAALIYSLAHGVGRGPRVSEEVQNGN